jgi:hypothetical protein
MTTLSYAGSGNVSFGRSLTFANLGPGGHTFEVRHVSGTIFVDGFKFNCASGGGADRSAPTVANQQSDRTATSADGAVIRVPVEVKPGDLGVSVLVEGLPSAVTVQLLGPLGQLVASGGARVPGLSASGLDTATPLAAGNYTVTFPNTLLPGQTAAVSVVRAFPAPQ